MSSLKTIQYTIMERKFCIAALCGDGDTVRRMLAEGIDPNTIMPQSKPRELCKDGNPRFNSKLIPNWFDGCSALQCAIAGIPSPEKTNIIRSLVAHPLINKEFVNAKGLKWQDYTDFFWTRTVWSAIPDLEYAGWFTRRLRGGGHVQVPEQHTLDLIHLLS
jgi:hypothetical protein